MKLDQPWCTHLHYQIDNQLLILCKQEVTTPKRHTDIIRDKTWSTWRIYAHVSACVCVCMYVCAEGGGGVCARVSAHVYVSIVTYTCESVTAWRVTIIITQLINSEVRNIARQNKKRY